MQVARGQNVSSSKEELQVLSTQVNKKKRKFKGKRKLPDFSKMQCFRCDKIGHPTSKCPNRIKPQASFTTTQMEILNIMPSIQHSPVKHQPDQALG